MRRATPYFEIDESALEENLKTLQSVAKEADCRILLAQKAYSIYQTYSLIAKYLAGSTASGLYEARLGHTHMGGETHVFSPAYDEESFDELLGYVDHLSFNSFHQWKRFKDKALAHKKSCGVRVNPACSTQGAGMYDPCAPKSRLGILRKDFDGQDLSGLEGLHFHTLCEQNVDALEETLHAFEAQFGEFLPQMRWLNLGGGHHITRADYDRRKLIDLLQGLHKRYPHLTLYLEPGEAVVLNAGVLVSTVQDIVHNDGDLAILDASAACHMPDVLEVPYTPPLFESSQEGDFLYRLGGPTCLAGDVIGDYRFDAPLSVGTRLTFGDMALYTMVKTNTFNGMPLPAIFYKKKDGSVETIRTFGYEDFKNRL